MDSLRGEMEMVNDLRMIVRRLDSFHDRFHLLHLLDGEKHQNYNMEMRTAKRPVKRATHGNTLQEKNSTEHVDRCKLDC